MRENCFHHCHIIEYLNFKRTEAVNNEGNCKAEASVPPCKRGCKTATVTKVTAIEDGGMSISP